MVLVVVSDRLGAFGAGDWSGSHESSELSVVGGTGSAHCVWCVDDAH